MVKALPEAPASKTGLEKIEIAYCLFLFLLVLSYNVYLELGATDPNDDSWFLVILVFVLTYLVSGLVIVVRLIRKFLFRKPLPFPVCHLLYVAFCTVSVIYDMEIDYAKRYVEARAFYARQDSPCRVESQKNHGVAACFVFANFPRIDAILIDPNQEMSKPRDQWQPATVQYFEARKVKILHLIKDCPTNVDHFYDDVYYVRARCQ